MPSFSKPKFSFPFDLNDEIDHLLQHKAHRNISAKSNDKLLMGSWNIANLGLQKRHSDH